MINSLEPKLNSLYTKACVMTGHHNQQIAKPLYSLAHLTLTNFTPAELVYVAARAGYDAVSSALSQ